MKAITLWQPYASLIACGAKRFETRSWAPPKKLIGERIAIHAAKKCPEQMPPFFTGLVVGELLKVGMYPKTHAGLDTKHALRPLPRGCLVCSAILAGAFRVGYHSRYGGDSFAHGTDLVGSTGSYKVRIDKWGDFSVGRWIWVLEHVKVFDEPILCSGHQRIWETDLC